MLYIILVVPLLVCWKNQVRCTSVARAYLGLFSFLFLREGLLDLACLLACFNTAENEPCKDCPLSAYRSPRFYNTHATDPNTEMIRYFDEDRFEIYALRDIEVGEELTHTYRSLKWRKCFVDQQADGAIKD